MSTSIPPPASSGGGNAKYAVIGVVLLLGAALAIYFVAFKSPPPAVGPVVAARDAGAPDVQQGPIGPQIGANIQLALDEPDAGPDVIEDAAAQRPRIRYVTRYVAACPGTVDGARVAAVIRQNYGGLRECYNRQLRTNPTLRGNVTTEFIINTNGTVGQIATSGAVARDRAFKQCFESSLQRLRFPSPRGGCAMYQQGFTFTPGG